MNPRHDFPNRIQETPSAVRYLAHPRRGIVGPRTLAKAYSEYRRQSMVGTVELLAQDRERIRRLDPRKVDWSLAYAWWKTRDTAEAET